MRIKNIIMFVSCFLAIGLQNSSAQEYPVRPIQIIVPYSAGGGTDLSARIMADTFQKLNPGTKIVIRNQPGGGGSIGTSAAIHARADGYTLGTGSQGPIALLPHYGGIDYTIADMTFVAMMGRNLQLVIACAKAPFDTLDEFIAYGKGHPGGIQVGNSGAGGANHISMAAMGKVAGIDFKHVPFNGASEAITACLGGHIDALTLTPAEGAPHVESGTVKALFIMEDERIDSLPDVPTLKEAGIDFTWSSWKGIIAPKGIPANTLAFLQSAFKAVFTNPDFIKQMEDIGEFVDYRDAKEYEALARRDSEMAGAVIEELGMAGMNQK